MADPFLGEIRVFGFNFAPVGWAQCNGQQMAISQNTALFALLGTQYGGNGTTTFNLPDLRSRVPLNQGQGLGLSNYVIGQQGGGENVGLQLNNMPAHNHTVTPGANDSAATATRPGGAVLARTSAAIYASASDGTTMASATTSTSGSNVPFSVIQPYLALNFCIALQGIFPSRG
ncbi:MAG TPA: tail fiber protein [Acidimicrobiales bacterium]|nr:tail fiber protein [Acidimicrobiales bacterium]